MAKPFPTRKPAKTPLTPKATRSAFDAPDPLKADTRPVLSPPATPPAPAPKAPAKRRAQPAVGARGGAPHNPQVAPETHHSLAHAVDVGLGTGLAAAKSIPGTLYTPLHLGATHTPVQDVHPQTFAQATGETPKKLPSDYPDLFNGGRTKDSPDKQVQQIKIHQGGKITKAQYHNLIMSAVSGEVSTKALAGLPTIHNFFPSDTRKLYTDKYGLPQDASDLQIINALAADNKHKDEGYNKLNPFRHGLSHVLDNIGEDYVHPLFNDLVVAPAHIAAGTLALSFEAGKSLGSGDSKYVKKSGKEALHGLQSAKTGIAHILQHPGKAVQEDPLGVALTAVTGGDTALGKIASSRLLDNPGFRALRGGKTADEWANTDRVVSLPDYATKDQNKQDAPLQFSRGRKSKKPATRLIQNWLDRHAGDGVFGTSPFTSLAKMDSSTRPGRPISKGDSLLGKEVKHARDVVSSRGENTMNALIQDMMKAARKHKISVARQVELLHTHAQGVSHAEMAALYSKQLEETTQALAKLREEGGNNKRVKRERTHLEQVQQNLRTQIDFHDPTRTVVNANAVHAEEIARIEKARTKSQANADAYAAKGDNHPASGLADPGMNDPVHGLNKKYDDQVALANAKRDQILAKAAEHGVPPTDAELVWLEKARALSDHRTALLHTYANLGDTAAVYRNHEAAIQVAAKTTRGPVAEIANAILDARTKMAKLEQKYRHDKNFGRRPLLIKRTDTRRAKDEINYQTYTDDLERNLKDFVNGRLDESPSVSTEPFHSNPFRVPREAPKPANRFSRGTKSGDINPTLDFTRAAGSMQRSTSKQLLEGNFTPSRDPLIMDALKAQKAASGVDFVNHVLDDSKLGVIRLNRLHGVGRSSRTRFEGIAVGDVVADPSMWVLRDASALRRLPTFPRGKFTTNRRPGASAEKNDAIKEEGLATQDQLEQAYKDSLKDEHLSKDTVVPADGDYVLVPRGVDEALKADLSHRAARGAVNSFYRTSVLYTRIGFPARNLAQAVATNTLEKVGPLSYIRAARNKLPVAPGVENTGLAGQALQGDFRNAHSLVNLLKDPLKVESLGTSTGVPDILGMAKAGHIHILLDTVRKLNLDFENFARRAAYHKISVKEARHQTTIGKRINLNMGRVTDDMQQMLEDFANGNTSKAEASAKHITDRIMEIQGDYKNMPAWNTAQIATPFYRWTLFASTLLMKLPWKHWVANQIVQGLGNVGAQVQTQLGQDLGAGGPLPTSTNFPIPGTGSNLKNATTFNAEYANPFTTTLDVVNTPVSLLPLIKTAMDAYESRDTFGNPLTDHYGQPLDTRGKLANVLNTVTGLVPPLRIADSQFNPGRHSGDSLVWPYNLLPGHEVRSAHTSKQTKRDDINYPRPHDSGWKAFVNWATGVGLHTKNLDATELLAAKRAYKAYLNGKPVTDQKKRDNITGNNK